MSVVKWAMTADSNPFFQKSQPKITPPTPLRTIARATIRAFRSTKEAVIGKCPSPNMTAAKRIEIMIPAVGGSVRRRIFIVIQIKKVIRNSLIRISSVIPP